MNTDLLKSILSIIAAAIPPLISLIFFLIQRSERISIPLDSPAIKVLKIQRFSVDERNFNIINIVIVFIALIIYIFLLSINEGSQNFYKQIIIFLLFIILVYFYFITFRMTYKNGNYIKNANNAKAYLFKSSEIEVEADYSYLFNKSYRVLKSMNYQIEEVNRHEGTLEACNIHLGGIDEASRLKIKLEEVEKLKKIYKVKIEFMNKVTLPQSSKITNRFLNLLISKTKEADQKVERKIDITTDEMD